MWCKGSSLNVILSADDIGLTESITDGIAGCVQKGTVSSVSVVANGYAFEHAIRKIRDIRPCLVSVHLNTVECAPLADPRDIPDLLDPRGQSPAFAHDSFSLRHPDGTQPGVSLRVRANSPGALPSVNPIDQRMANLSPLLNRQESRA